MAYPTFPVQPEGVYYSDQFDPRMYPKGYVNGEGHDPYRGSVDRSNPVNRLFDSKELDETYEEHEKRIEAELIDPGGGKREWEEPGKSAALEAEGEDIMDNYVDALRIFEARKLVEDARDAGSRLEPIKSARVASEYGPFHDSTQDFVNGLWMDDQRRRFRPKSVLEPTNETKEYHRHQMLFDELRKARKADAKYTDDVMYESDPETMKATRATFLRKKRKLLKGTHAHTRTKEFAKADYDKERRDATRTREARQVAEYEARRVAEDKARRVAEDKARRVAEDKAAPGPRSDPVVTRAMTKRQYANISSKLTYV